MSRIPESRTTSETMRPSADDGFPARTAAALRGEAAGRAGPPHESGDPDDLDALATASVEGWRSPAEGDSWWRTGSA